MEQTWLINLGIATHLEKENFEFKLVKFFFEIDLASQPAHGEEWVNRYIIYK